jgi:hypothetical protein
MEILYVRKIKTVSAIQVNISTASLELDSFFNSLGCSLITVRIIEEAPFFLNSKNVILVFEQNGVENTLRCKYTDYICLQNNVLVVKGKSDFESDFEPIEPILESLSHQSNSMAI